MFRHMCAIFLSCMQLQLFYHIINVNLPSKPSGSTGISYVHYIIFHNGVIIYLLVNIAVIFIKVLDDEYASLNTFTR
jgi:hypothetical protein